MKTIKSSVLTGPTRSVRSVVFSPDGATLVSASLDTTTTNRVTVLLHNGNSFRKIT